jgi:hypothetical protein
MENVRKLEVMVASWYKNMPHLPKNGQKWLSENAWWLVLLWVVLGAMGVGGVIMATFFAGALLSSVGPVAAAVGGIAFVAVVIAMLFSVVILVLSGMAIAPLRALQKKGWTLLFIVVLLEVAAHAASFLLSFNLFALVSNLLFTAVGAYFLFEIRDMFVASHAKKAVAKKKA